MRKVFFLSAMILALTFIAGPSYAAKVCLIDNFGSYWELKGGKIDKKTYTAKLINPTNFCTGYADATLTNSGNLVVSFYNAHNTTATCQTVFWSATTNLLFAGSGEYDIWGDGSIEGNFTVAPVSCTILPPTLSEDMDAKQETVTSTHPSIPKQ
ncbi:hypothetical protein L0244_12695 [bacterium]|nr:hypothetical protein [bacterium]